VASKKHQPGAIMPINHDEIIEEIEGHIRKFGGGFGEWCVGTAKDSRGPFFRRHLAADLGDGLAYREAFTTTAAQAVVDHLVNDRDLKLDLDAVPEAERRSALHGAVPEPGKIVFVYRQTRDTGFGAGEKGSGIRCQVSGAEPGMGVGDSGKVGATPPAPHSDHAAPPGAPHRPWLVTAIDGEAGVTVIVASVGGGGGEDPEPPQFARRPQVPMNIARNKVERGSRLGDHADTERVGAMPTSTIPGTPI
jgi:hypothetical protein